MTRVLASILLVVCFAHASFAGGITLKRAARLMPGETLTLGEIARLTEDIDRDLRAVPVTVPGDASGAITLSLDDIRDALRNAGHDPSRFALSGSRCVLRVIRTEAEEAPVVAPVEPTWSPSTDEHTFHARIVRILEEHYGTEGPDLRVAWQDRDHGFLDRTDPNVRLVVETLSTGDAARAALLVRLWRDDAIIETRTLRADIEIRRTTWYAAREIRRGDTLTDDDLRAERQFVRPDGNELIASTGEAVGMVARKTIREGAALSRGHLEPPLLVERGQVITLYCMRGTIEVRSTVRAKEDGVHGQVIEIQKPGSRETMFARVDGPARVTVAGAPITDPTKGTIR
ncbi:MAG: flagellar basal body P-ring formation chaperone FlgA [Phycisphaerales bacterium]